MNEQESHFVAFLRLIQPGMLALTALTYGLGASVAHYLGHRFPATLFMQGLLILLNIQVVGRLVLALNEPASDPSSPRPSIFPPVSSLVGEERISRERIQVIAMGFLALGALQAISLLISGIPAAAWIPLLLITFGAYFYSAEPLSLRTTGLGELTLGLLAGAIPMYAFLLLSGELHRFIIMTSSPLAALAFAAQVVLALPCFAYDQKNNRQNLLTRLGWETAMWFHDLAILLAMTSIVIATWNGLPDRVVLSTLLAAPLALLQMYQMRRIQGGAPPRYKLFGYTAISLYTLTAYLMLLGFIL